MKLQCRKYSHLFDVCLEKVCPEVARHKEELGVQTDIFFFQWLQCGFLSVLPLEVATAIWDLFLIDGTVVFYRVALAIFTMLRGELVKADYENFIKIITCHADKRGLWKDVMDEKTLLSVAGSVSLPFDVGTVLHRYERENV